MSFVNPTIDEKIEHTLADLQKYFTPEDWVTFETLKKEDKEMATKKSDKGNQKTDDTLDESSEDLSSEDTESSTGEPIYTEEQLQEKLNAQKSTLQKETQSWKDKYADLEAAKNALEGQLEDIEILKTHNAELTGQLEAKFPDDVKQIVRDYNVKKLEAIETSTKTRREFNSLKTDKLNRIIDGYEAKYEGVDRERLLRMGDETKIKAYVADLPFKVKSSETTETKTVETKAPAEKMPAPPTGTKGTSGGLSNKDFLQAYAEGRSNDHARFAEVSQNINNL
jgi:hypothetical protein